MSSELEPGTPSLPHLQIKALVSVCGHSLPCSKPEDLGTGGLQSIGSRRVRHN